MAVEEARLRIRQSLEEKLGVEEAAYLMDRPIGGWSDLVTNQTLDLRLGLARSELRTEMADLRTELRTEMADLRAEMQAGFRRQTWQLATLMVSGMAVIVTVFGILGKG